jgi:hypothetical protein
MRAGPWVATLTSVVLIAAPVAASEPVPVQRPGAAAPEAAPPTAEPAPPAVEPTAEAAPPAEVAPAVESSPASTPTESAPAESAPAEPPPPAAPFEADDDEVTEAEVAAATPTEADIREIKLRRAQSMIAVGAVAALAGFVMAVAAGVEHAKADCKFGLDDCANAPRPAVTKGLGIGGAIGLVGGAALVGIGVYKLRKLRASVAVDGRSAGVVLSGRF